MIFIVVKFTVKPEHRETWLEAVRPFTEATRAEPGNLWFDWSRSVENPDQFILVEAFRDGDAPAEHVGSDHFKTAMEVMPAMLAFTPEILNAQIPGSTWSEMGELTVPATD
ncbi:MAG: putative quinol monooxygenase [Dermatophilaceae bacterium]